MTDRNLSEDECGGGYPSGLVASDFELLIRMFYSPDHLTQPHDTYKRLCNAGLIDREDELSALTTRGVAFVRYILATPLPTQRWEIQR